MIEESSQDPGNYYETNKCDEYMQEKYITPYDDKTFWDELIDRLAMRDVINEVGEEDFYKMDGLERITLIDRASKYDADEFALNGVEGIWVGPLKLLTTNKH